MQPMAITIRRGCDEDRPIELLIARAAWEAAYSHIFSAREIHDLFSGALQQSASWSADQAGRFGSVIADLDGTAVGTAWLGLLRNGEGEVASLYVHPKHQKRGIGRALWNAAVADLRRRACSGLRVWAIDRSNAGDFYRHLGCTAVGHGSFRVGPHTEATTCYRLPFQ